MEPHTARSNRDGHNGDTQVLEHLKRPDPLQHRDAGVVPSHDIESNTAQAEEHPQELADLTPVQLSKCHVSHRLVCRNSGQGC